MEHDTVFALLPQILECRRAIAFYSSEDAYRLEVREDGLHETEDGIQSFVPWSSVRSFTVFGDTLFIELSANLWAIVPRGSVSPDPNAVDELIGALRGRGIKEVPKQAA